MTSKKAAHRAAFLLKSIFEHGSFGYALDTDDRDKHGYLILPVAVITIMWS
jgi:hypothetical protein